MGSNKSSKEFRPPLADRSTRLLEGPGGGPWEQELARRLEGLRDVHAADRASLLPPDTAELGPHLAWVNGRLIYTGPVPDGDLVEEAREERIRALLR